jgi:hypothetical protein
MLMMREAKRLMETLCSAKEVEGELSTHFVGSSVDNKISLADVYKAALPSHIFSADEEREWKTQIAKSFKTCISGRGSVKRFTIQAIDSSFWASPTTESHVKTTRGSREM